MGISIDSSFLVEIVSFLILWAILKRLLFDPMLGVLEERERRTDGNLKAAEDLRNQAAALRDEHETSIHVVRRAVTEQGEESRKAALAEERQIIAASRDQAAVTLNNTRAEIAAQIEEARQRLSGQAANLATQIADRATAAAGRAHRRRRSRWSLTAGMAPSLLIALPALAAAAEEGGHESGHGIPWMTLGFACINFGLFIYVIFVRGILPSLRSYALARRDRVVREIEEASKARAEAEQLRQEWEQRVENLEREIAEIRDRALADAQHDREKILADARAAAVAIEADARRAAAQEIHRAEAQLRDDVGREAVAIAERLLRERITKDDQHRFVDDFLRQVRP